MAKQQAEKELIFQTRMDHQSITDLAATKLEDKLTKMMANFMTQMQPNYNPLPPHPTAVITPTKPQDPPSPKQTAKRDASPGSPTRIAPPLRKPEEINSEMKQDEEETPQDRKTNAQNIPPMLSMDEETA